MRVWPFGGAGQPTANVFARDMTQMDAVVYLLGGAINLGLIILIHPATEGLELWPLITVLELLVQNLCYVLVLVHCSPSLFSQSENHMYNIPHSP
jgi:hypothetical protein